MAGSVTSSHRTRKILWDGPHPGSKINSRGRCGKLHLIIAEVASKTERGVSDALRSRGHRDLLCEGRDCEWGGEFPVFLKARTLLPQTGPQLQVSVSPLRTHKISKIFMLFSRGCFFLTSPTPALWLIQTAVHLQTLTDTTSLPWVNHTHWEFRSRAGPVTNTKKPSIRVSRWRQQIKSVPLKTGLRAFWAPSTGRGPNAGCRAARESDSPGPRGGEGKVPELEAHPVQFWTPARLPTNDHCGISGKRAAPRTPPEASASEHCPALQPQQSPSQLCSPSGRHLLPPDRPPILWSPA